MTARMLSWGTCFLRHYNRDSARIWHLAGQSLTLPSCVTPPHDLIKYEIDKATGYLAVNDRIHAVRVIPAAKQDREDRYDRS
jgi:hypothetical protein